jgi:MoaA/NifB/PqqE/SkfB family radical SAM enzyme
VREHLRTAGLWIRTTGRCNLACVGCDRGPFPDRDATLDEIAKQLAYPYPVETINMCVNGETLLHPELAKIIEMCKEAHPEAAIVTVTSGMVEPSQTAGMARLGISMSGATKETFDIVRVKSDFDTVLQTIRDAVAVVPRVGFVYTATALNMHELPAAVELAHSLGVKEVYVQPFTVAVGAHNTATHLLLDNLPAATRSNYVETARAIADNLGVEFYHDAGVLPVTCTVAQQRNCAIPWVQVGMIQPYKKGYTIWPCCWLAQRKIPITAERYGWEFDDVPAIDALFNGEGYWRWREDKLSGAADDICEGCNAALGIQREKA